MATGRRDYTSGVLNESSIRSRYSEPYLDWISMNIIPSESKLFYTYTVPIGWKLGINRVGVWKGTGRGNHLRIYKGIIYKLFYVFDDECVVNLSGYNIIYFNAGETLNVYISNYDNVNTMFYGMIGGILESVD